MIRIKNLLENKILVPRRSKEEREKNYKIAIAKQIQQYIQNGSEGDLELGRTPVTLLPDNLKVGGYLKIEYTPITALPKGLKVERGLFATKTKIKELPEYLEVGEDLYLDRSLLQELPRNLKVGGNLHIVGTPLSKKYTEEEIRRKTPGVKGIILM